MLPEIPPSHAAELRLDHLNLGFKIAAGLDENSKAAGLLRQAVLHAPGEHIHATCNVNNMVEPVKPESYIQLIRALIIRVLHGNAVNPHRSKDGNRPFSGKKILFQGSGTCGAGFSYIEKFPREDDILAASGAEKVQSPRDNVVQLPVRNRPRIEEITLEGLGDELIDCALSDTEMVDYWKEEDVAKSLVEHISILGPKGLMFLRELMIDEWPDPSKGKGYVVISKRIKFMTRRFIQQVATRAGFNIDYLPVRNPVKGLMVCFRDEHGKPLPGEEDKQVKVKEQIAVIWRK